MMEIVLLVFIILLFIAFVIEIYLLHKYTETYEVWIGMVENYMEAFSEIRTVVNSNANLLRQVAETTNEHDQILKVMTVVVDLQSEALKIGKNFRENLSERAVTGYVMDLGEESEDQ